MKEYNEEKERQIVDSVLEDFKLRQVERKNFENAWQLNINFFIGNQYCYVSPNGEITEYGKQYFWQEREVYNHIANIIEVRLLVIGFIDKKGVKDTKSYSREELLDEIKEISQEDEEK